MSKHLIEDRTSRTDERLWWAEMLADSTVGITPDDVAAVRANCGRHGYITRESQGRDLQALANYRSSAEYIRIHHGA